MSLTLDDNKATYQIRGYQPGQIQVNETIYQHSIIVTPNNLISPWEVPTLRALTSDHLNIILTLKPSILLIGTGEELIFPPPALYGHLINAGIGVEIMNTRAACQTYNALCAEERNVAAALILDISFKARI